MSALLLRRENLLAAVHPRRFVETVRETKIAALRVPHRLDGFKRVMRPAVAGVAFGVAHAN